MNCWQILNIEPTQDVGVIKRAYAVLLKQNRPDQDPVGFRNLHEAYTSALTLSKSFGVIGEPLNTPIEELHQESSRQSTLLIEFMQSLSLGNEGESLFKTDDDLLADWKLPNQWLQQLQSITENCDYLKEQDWMDCFEQTKEFKNTPEILYLASNDLLKFLERRFSHWKSVTTNYTDSNIWQKFIVHMEEFFGLSDKVLAHIAKQLGWWDTPYDFNWFYDFDTRFSYALVRAYAPIIYQNQFCIRYHLTPNWGGKQQTFTPINKPQELNFWQQYRPSTIWLTAVGLLLFPAMSGDLEKLGFQIFVAIELLIVAFLIVRTLKHKL